MVYFLQKIAKKIKKKVRNKDREAAHQKETHSMSGFLFIQ